MTHERENAIAWFEERIPSRMDAAESLCRKLRGALEERGLSGLCFATELIARECLANAVIHGNRNDPAKSVVFQLWIGRTWIRLQVTDEGAGFDWRQGIEKTMAVGETSGRGLHVCALYAEVVRFNRCGNRITCWTRKKKRIGKGD